MNEHQPHSLKVIKDYRNQVGRQAQEIEQLRAENERLREKIQYWSYCTWAGMECHCPEEYTKLSKWLGGLGIHPYHIMQAQEKAGE